ncbi:MAG TPA: 30S ribosomal protein S20 [Acidobacteriota bacterium]|nr:30S ribosomal protein S20 [Acidobacteriota bacterium]
MPVHKSCKKRVRTSEEQRQRNRAFRSRMRNVVKAVRTETSKEEAAKKLREAISMLDQAASLKLIHRGHANRHKSRLASFVNKLG